MFNRNGGKRTMSENQKEWKKVESEIFKFEKDGDMIEGKLVSAEDSHMYDNKVYKIEGKDKKVKVIFGTTVLDSQMVNVSIGKDVKIVFTGVKENPKSGQNDIKLFEVFVH